MASVNIRSLGYHQGDFSLEVDLSLSEGEFGLIVGPSGCGKSTLLRLVAGLLEAGSGSIELGGRELRGLSPEERRVGLVFQDFALFPHLSARRNIEYGLRLAGLDRETREGEIAALASSFHIGNLLDRLPSQLSGGEQQRVALARSLAVRPDLLLLDEPLSSLDASLRRELRSEIRERVKEARVPALQVSHDLEEALALADRIFLMKDGRIVESGEPEEVWQRPKTAFAARLLGRGPVFAVDGLERRGTVLLARTREGPFSLGATPDFEGLREGEFSILLPSSALRPLGSSRTVPEDEDAPLLRGRVVSSSFSGATRRILLQGEAERFEIEMGFGPRPAPGDTMAFIQAPGAAILLEGR